MIALDRPPIPVIPRAVRVFLACRTSRMTIMRVRRVLSDSDIEKYERLDQKAAFTNEYW